MISQKIANIVAHFYSEIFFSSKKEKLVLIPRKVSFFSENVILYFRAEYACPLKVTQGLGKQKVTQLVILKVYYLVLLTVCEN